MRLRYFRDLKTYEIWLIYDVDYVMILAEILGADQVSENNITEEHRLHYTGLNG